MTEDHPFNNKNFYGATKIAAKRWCARFIIAMGSILSGCVT